MPGPIKNIFKKLLSKLSKPNKVNTTKPRGPWTPGATSNPEFQALLNNSRRSNSGFSASDISVKLNKNYPYKGNLDANFQDWVKKHGLTKPKGEGGAVGPMGPNGIL